MPKTVPNY